MPWGRSLDEYWAMFALSEADMRSGVLGCGDGPASFNAEATEAGWPVVSVDPLYTFRAEEIARRVGETFDAVVGQTMAAAARFVWYRISDADALGRERMAIMRRLLADYCPDRQAGRYVAASLPVLPFAGRRFGLALSSHLLFLYSDHLTLDFHLGALREMLRVAGEARVFPLLALDGNPSPHVAPLTRALAEEGYAVEQVRVPYEFQKNGHTMLRVRRA